jgi:O-methyltransferase
MNRPSIQRIARALRWLLTGTPAQRRRVRQEMARMSAGLFGDFPLSDDFKAWREDKAFLANYNKLSPQNPYSQDRKWTLREFVRMSNGLPGDMAECGCYQGATAFFMLEASSGGLLYLFDSFEGISTPKATDQSKQADVMPWNKGDLCSNEETLRRNLAEFDQIRIMKGWIPERFGEVTDRRFRIVHIDVDLYQPTRDSLEFFYPRLVPGGFIVMDDYGLLTCPGAKLAADEYAKTQGVKILHLPTGQGIITRPTV